MAIVDDIAAIRARQDLSVEAKRRQVATIKATALYDVILNGKPAPQPIQPLLGRTFTTRDGVTVTCLSAALIDDGDLMLTLELTRPPMATVTHTVIFVNPPILPAISTGNEKRDLIAAASEMVEGFV
jgi:hypothetical protein